MVEMVKQDGGITNRAHLSFTIVWLISSLSLRQLFVKDVSPRLLDASQVLRSQT